MKRVKAIILFGILGCVLLFGGCDSESTGYQEMQEILQAENFDFGARIDEGYADFIYNEEELAAFANWYVRENPPS